MSRNRGPQSYRRKMADKYGWMRAAIQSGTHILIQVDSDVLCVPVNDVVVGWQSPFDPIDSAMESLNA